MSLFGKKQSSPVRPLAAYACEYVTTKGVGCSVTARHKCYQCGIRLCNVDAQTCEYEVARERAVRKYCVDCVVALDFRHRAGKTEFVDVQPLNLDAYSVDMPVRRSGPVKWEN